MNFDNNTKLFNNQAEQLISKINSETDQSINNIYKDQLANLSQFDTLKSGQFSLFINDNGQLKEVKFFFKKQENLNQQTETDGSKKQSF